MKKEKEKYKREKEEYRREMKKEKEEYRRETEKEIAIKTKQMEMDADKEIKLMQAKEKAAGLLKMFREVFEKSHYTFKSLSNPDAINKFASQYSVYGEMTILKNIALEICAKREFIIFVAAHIDYFLTDKVDAVKDLEEFTQLKEVKTNSNDKEVFEEGKKIAQKLWEKDKEYRLGTLEMDPCVKACRQVICLDQQFRKDYRSIWLDCMDYLMHSCNISIPRREQVPVLWMHHTTTKLNPRKWNAKLRNQLFPRKTSLYPNCPWMRILPFTYRSFLSSRYPINGVAVLQTNPVCHWSCRIHYTPRHLNCQNVQIQRKLLCLLQDLENDFMRRMG
eukprot:TRINITY_DN2226_c0_g1_i3.p1 TRINITY_DN2226_c0_g1~~TRINITY_DN2226_c0_g1_i3.p1  ORF type:complete len:375 (-),score=48.10 TRINITY_DN2226_c0_g1_i3:481-1482(-)